MKTKKNLLFGLSIAILLVFSGCQDDFGDLYYDYVGFWDSENYVLQIWAGGDAYLLKRGKYEYYGWVDINQNRIKFKADGEDFTKRFSINQPPSVDEFGIIYMELDRWRFTLQ